MEPVCKRMIAAGRSRRGTDEMSIHTSSVEPPPISTTSNCSVLVDTSGAQEITARRASSSGWMISSVRPVSRLTCRMKSREFFARRHASVATSRIRLTLLRFSFCWQIRSACMVRAIEDRDSRPVRSRPAPNCTDLEKLSTTWNPLPLGWAINMRQLFVPRSSAAYNASGSGLAGAGLSTAFGNAPAPLGRLGAIFNALRFSSYPDHRSGKCLVQDAH